MINLICEKCGYEMNFIYDSNNCRCSHCLHFVETWIVELNKTYVRVYEGFKLIANKNLNHNDWKTMLSQPNDPRNKAIPKGSEVIFKKLWCNYYHSQIFKVIYNNIIYDIEVDGNEFFSIINKD